LKSIEITSDSYAGVPADKEALTSTDIDAVFKSGDWKGASAALVSCIKGYVAQAEADAVTIAEEIAKQKVPVIATAISIPETENVVVGEEVVIPVTFTPAGCNQIITAASGTEAKGTVEVDAGYKSVTVTGIAAGDTEITVTCGSQTDTCTVTVTAAEG
jgi:uncharacterized protein YjdB